MPANDPLHTPEEEQYDWGGLYEEDNDDNDSPKRQKEDEEESGDKEGEEKESEESEGEGEEGEGAEGEAGESGAEGAEGAEAGAEAGAEVAAEAAGEAAVEVAAEAAVEEGGEAAAAAAGPEILIIVLIIVVIIILVAAVASIFSGGKSGSTTPTNTSGATCESYALPVEEKFYKGDPTPHFHHNYASLDISPMPNGSPIYSASCGKVTHVGLQSSGDINDGYGYYIEILGDDGLRYFYGHLTKDSATVAQGAIVKAGDQIAISDNTGSSTGPHLHLEIRCGDPSKVKGGCKLGDKFPHADRNDAKGVNCTGPWKFIETIINKGSMSDSTGPWAKYGHCPHTSADDVL